MPEKTKVNVKEKFSLKDELFNAHKVEKIAKEIENVYDTFEISAFVADVLVKFPELELKERIYHISDMFKKYLPNDYVKATNILLQALPAELDNNKTDDDFGDFIYAPYSEYVVAYGCNDEHLNFSLQALRELTKRFSVEFSIRDFINNYPQETLTMLNACALSKNYHERRLASEGLRVKLPWAKKLTLDYKETMQNLELLYVDNTRYVTRSVANHMNDISKIDAPLVLETLKRWENSKKQESKEMAFIIKHSLRTLVKNGNEEALTYLGYKKHPHMEVVLQLNAKEVFIGEALVFDVEIEAKEEVNLMVDYIIHFRTKQGTLSPKVHKLKQITMKKNQKVTLKKKHLFKANMSTRTFYEGEHKIELQVNGTRGKCDFFELKN